MNEIQDRHDRRATRPGTDDRQLSDAELDTIAGGTNRKPAHPGGVNALMGDGSVRFIRDSIDI